MNASTRTKRVTLLGAAIAAVAVLALGTAPLVGFGADHLDAPDATSPGNRPAADINDVYVFQGHNGYHTVLAMTTHPAAGAIAPLAYATDVAYKLNVDRNGDAMQDLVYRVRFGPRHDNHQFYRVWRVTLHNSMVTSSKVVAKGWTGKTNSIQGGGWVFAGLRSDPFFFDLDAFHGSVLGMGPRRFCDGHATDFFKPLNANAIVIEVPDGVLGKKIGVWGITTANRTNRLDRMGRPAINTVFNSGNDKNRFNETSPGVDYARFSGNVIGTLKALSGLDSDGSYTTAQATGLAHVLLPDILTYDTSTKAVGPLNGRALSDDVIDAELNIVTGGYPFPGRHGTGAIPSDCVGPHHDYQSVFPYLGTPH